MGSQRDMLRSLAGASAEQRATIYSHILGQRITYDSERGSIVIEPRPVVYEVSIV